VYTYRSSQSDYRLVRRSRRWFIECDGNLAGPFRSAADAALAAAETDLLASGGPVPGDLSQWTRGALPPRESASARN
jgi:hypothetical protein